MNNENSFKNLRVYAVIDKLTNNMHNICIGYNDKDVSSWFLNQLKESIKKVDEKAHPYIADYVNKSCFAYIGYFDILSHDFVKDENVLLNFDFEVLLEEIKNESEKENVSEEERND